MTPTRSSPEFADFILEIAAHYSAADTIHLVVDNLSTHPRKALTDRFGEEIGGWLWNRFTVHYTPTHGSWLNQAEIEISLLGRQCLGTNLIKNKIVSNNSTASSGVLFQTLFAPLASTQGTNCASPTNSKQSCAQPAGLVSVTNSAVLMANLPASVTCPAGHFTTPSATNGNCTLFSVPILYNDLFWQNRSLMISVGTQAAGITNQQNTVTVYNPEFGTTPAPAAAQSATGSCTDTGTSPSAHNYWDIGVRGDTAPGNHAGGGSLSPIYSALTSSAEVGSGTNDFTLTPTLNVVAQFCNGSRVPVEAGTLIPFAGWQTPPGTNESNALPGPLFTLSAAATVDEGNNWINLRWGPLSLNYTGVNFNAAPAAGSNAVDKVPTNSVQGLAAPSIDFYGNPRGQNPIDIGAIELPPPTPILSVTPTFLTFASTGTGSTSAAQTLTLANTGTGGATGIAVAVTAQFSRPTGTAGGTCTTTLAANSTCTINIVFAPTAAGTITGTATITANVAVSGSPVQLSGTAFLVTHNATVTPSSLAFGNQQVGVASAAQTLTVTNTGTGALAGGTFTFAGGSTQYSRPAGAAGGTCGAAWAVGANCTINVVFTPTTTGSLPRALTIAYTGATVTNSPVGLAGTGVQGTLSFTSATNGSIAPNNLGGRTLTFTIPSPRAPVTSIVTITNTAAAGTLTVTGETITQLGSLFSVTGSTCTSPVAPGGTCTVSVRYNTPATRPGTANAAILNAANNGTGTVLGVSMLGLSAR